MGCAFVLEKPRPVANVVLVVDMLRACDFEALVKMATEKGWIGKEKQE